MATELIALESSKQTAFTKAVRNIKKSIAAKKVKDEEEKYARGIILVNHLPYGFFEDGLRSFFSQFGKVLRLRLARSKKTGRSKGYAFVEFEFEEVAKIAAESMDNYLMFERVVKCKLLPTGTSGKKIFAGYKIREDNCPKLKRRNDLKKRQAEPMKEEELVKHKNYREKIIVQHNNRLAKLGIDYQFNWSPKMAKQQEQLTPDIRKSKILTPPVQEPKILNEISKSKTPTPPAQEQQIIKETQKSKTPPVQAQLFMKEISKGKTLQRQSMIKKLEMERNGSLERQSLGTSNAKLQSSDVDMEIEENENLAIVKINKEMPEKKTKLSPRVLRSVVKSRQSVSANELISTIQAELECQTRTPAKRTKTPVKQTTTPAKQAKIPVKQTNTPAKQVNIPTKQESIVKSKPKFSPKLLRSRTRQSEGLFQTQAPSNPSVVAKGKGKQRKSMK